MEIKLEGFKHGSRLSDLISRVGIFQRLSDVSQLITTKCLSYYQSIPITLVLDAVNYQTIPGICIKMVGRKTTLQIT